MNILRPRALLALILLLYLALGVLFAVKTPAWQAPDEPAHYNYVRYLAGHGQFPVLQMGDYPHAYLDEIKSRRFPPDLSIDPIRYEFHQPPLYYALAAPLYSAAGGASAGAQALLALRLFSVLLGAGIVLLAYAVAGRVFPGRSGLALGTAAFVAFLPQHLATVSQVGNDVLAELLFAAMLYLLVEWVQGAEDRGQRAVVRGQRTEGRDQRSEVRGRGAEVGEQGAEGRGQGAGDAGRRAAAGIGVLLGLILITKTTAYIAVPLAAGALIWRWWRERAGFRRILVEGAIVALPAALIALPWFARDVAVYGWPDFLGLHRHDLVVVGQPRTGDWLAQYGLGGYLQRLAEFTFKSFWGVFGWLGVFMDSRAYFVLLLLSMIALGGLAARIVRHLTRKDKPPHETRSPQYAIPSTQYAVRNTPAIRRPPATRTHRALTLLATSALLTVLVYAWYNLQFVQHQGRYLFTALIPIAIFFCLGWEEALRPRTSRVLAALLAIFGIGLAAWGGLAGDGLPKWPLAFTLLSAAGLAARPWLPRRLDPLLFALPFAALPLLALYALFGAIVPQLAR